VLALVDVPSGLYETVTHRAFDARGSRTFVPRTMQRRITGFHEDPEHHWVAELECGHKHHVRHEPPWQVYPWVTTPEGRVSRLGTTLQCRLCDGVP